MTQQPDVLLVTKGHAYQRKPLLRSDFTFTANHFPQGGVGFESHPVGSNLVGWTKQARQSPTCSLATSAQLMRMRIAVS